MSTSIENTGSKEASPPISWTQFLESQPPNQLRIVTGLAKFVNSYNEHPHWELSVPPINLHCESDNCGGIRIFDSLNKGDALPDENGQTSFLFYRCRHCLKPLKIYAVYVLHSNGEDGKAMKIGEIPPFGPHIPTKMFKLLGDDQELFHKGRRAESQGMGIAAFAYYRRVVENQKNRLVNEIAKVCIKLNAAPAIIAEMEKARSETRFTTALDILRDALPNALLIENHNPLGLLHTALSDGLHGKTDEECLDRAQSIRLVLAELSERIAFVLKEDTELKGAVAKLLQVKADKAKPPSKCGQPAT